MSGRVIIITGMIIGQNIHQQDSAGFRHQLKLDIKTDVFCFVFFCRFLVWGDQRLFLCLFVCLFFLIFFFFFYLSRIRLPHKINMLIFK
jgi:hypothetical protein